MIGLRYGEKNYDDMLSRFHLIPERYGQTDGQTDRQTDFNYYYDGHMSYCRIRQEGVLCDAERDLLAIAKFLVQLYFIITFGTAEK